MRLAGLVMRMGGAAVMADSFVTFGCYRYRYGRGVRVTPVLPPPPGAVVTGRMRRPECQGRAQPGHG
jgi:hypothetical protein